MSKRCRVKVLPPNAMTASISPTPPSAFAIRSALEILSEFFFFFFEKFSLLLPLAYYRGPIIIL